MDMFILIFTTVLSRANCSCQLRNHTVCFISSDLCHTNHWTIPLQIREPWFNFVALRSFVSWYSFLVTQRQQWKILLTSAVPLQKCIMVPLWCPCVPCLSICSPTHPIVSLLYTSKKWIWVSWTTPSTQSKVCLSQWGYGDAEHGCIERRLSLQWWSVILKAV